MPKCDECGRKFKTPQGLGSHVGQVHNGNPTVDCHTCGKTFEKVKSRVEKHKRHFCSQSCRKSWLREEHNLSSKNSPSWNGGKVEIECSNCGTKMEKFESEVFDNNFCSDECFAEIQSEKMSGMKNPNWKEGKRSSYGHRWDEIREMCIEEMGEKCHECDISREECKESFGCDLHVHHLTPLREFDSVKNANKLDNLIPVCPSCHATIEQQ